MYVKKKQDSPPVWLHAEQTEKTASSITRSCPRFNKCDVPICPLDLLQEKRTYLKGEPHCTLAKSIRIRLAAGTELPLQGMTKKEWSGAMSWRKQSEDQRESRIRHLRAISPICPCDLESTDEGRGRDMQTATATGKSAKTSSNMIKRKEES